MDAGIAKKIPKGLFILSFVVLTTPKDISWQP